MKGCELCTGTARMYCESDQASLCFECDARVHAANFLVARHSRVLLCRTCQSPTPWKAEGPRLGPTVSVCDRCVTVRSTKKDADVDGGDGMEEEVEDDDGNDEESEEEDEEREEEEEEEGEEQVVPWTMNEEAAPPPPPAVVSSSSSEEDSTTTRVKRIRGNVDLLSSSSSQDQLPCSSSRSSFHLSRTGVLNPVRASADEEVTSYSSQPLKDGRNSDVILSGSHGLALDLMSFAAGRPPI